MSKLFFSSLSWSLYVDVKTKIVSFLDYKQFSRLIKEQLQK